MVPVAPAAPARSSLFRPWLLILDTGESLGCHSTPESLATGAARGSAAAGSPAMLRGSFQFEYRRSRQALERRKTMHLERPS
jgi:hypothetical protein